MAGDAQDEVARLTGETTRASGPAPMPGSGTGVIGASLFGIQVRFDRWMPRDEIWVLVKGDKAPTVLAHEGPKAGQTVEQWLREPRIIRLINIGDLMGTRVVNLKTGDHYDIYIGRPSVFGNPFLLGIDGNRDAVLVKYERYATDRVLKDAKFAQQVKSLHGKILGCYCKPLACHGDILIKISAELNR